MQNRFLLLLILATLAISSPSLAADVFLQIDGIPGDSADQRHRGQIDVASYTFGNKNSGTASYGGGGGAGKAMFTDLTVTKAVDSTSPKLMLACAEGTHLKKITLSVRKPGSPHDYTTITLSDVLVVAYKQSGDNRANITDEVTFAYSRIEFSYSQAKPDGSLATPPIKTGYDLKTNRRI